MKTTKSTRIVCRFAGCRKAADGATDATPYCTTHGEAIAASTRKVAWGRHSQFHPLTRDELVIGWGK